MSRPPSRPGKVNIRWRTHVGKDVKLDALSPSLRAAVILELRAKAEAEFRDPERRAGRTATQARRRARRAAEAETKTAPPVSETSEEADVEVRRASVERPSAA